MNNDEFWDRACIAFAAAGLPARDAVAFADNLLAAKMSKSLDCNLSTEELKRIMESSIDEIEFSSRVRKGLEKAGIKTVGELTQKSARELQSLAKYQIGYAATKEIRMALQQRGLALVADKVRKEPYPEKPKRHVHY